MYSTRLQGELLLRLLAAAEESGPYQCVGHSAGGKACLSFATAAASESVAVTVRTPLRRNTNPDPLSTDQLQRRGKHSSG